MEISPPMAILYSEEDFTFNIFVGNRNSSMLRWESQILTSLQPEWSQMHSEGLYTSSDYVLIPLSVPWPWTPKPTLDVPDESSCFLSGFSIPPPYRTSRLFSGLVYKVQTQRALPCFMSSRCLFVDSAASFAPLSLRPPFLMLHSCLRFLVCTIFSPLDGFS